MKVALSDLKEEERNRGARAEFMENHHGSRLSYLPAISCKSRKVVKRLRKGDDTLRSKLRPRLKKRPSGSFETLTTWNIEPYTLGIVRALRNV